MSKVSNEAIELFYRFILNTSPSVPKSPIFAFFV